MKKDNFIHILFISCIILLNILNTACEKESIKATTIAPVSGIDQTGQVLTTLSNPVEVLVINENGDGHEGVKVSFTVNEGLVSSENITTDKNGHASVIWTLGPTLGIQTLKATAEGLNGSPVEFNTTAVECMDYDGNVYNVVQIGNQLWMAENLKVTNFPNGEEITLVTDNTVWSNLSYNNTNDAYCFTNNDSKNGQGALYTYGAAIGDNWSKDINTNQGVCPTGWHLPSDAEWKELEIQLGMSKSEVDNTDWRGTNEGSKLAGNEKKWADGNLDTNSEFGTSGFQAFPDGVRSYSGSFGGSGGTGAWWSATETSYKVDAYTRVLSFYNSSVKRDIHMKNSGLSIRCLQD